MEKIPLKLAEMLEEGVEFLGKKYSSESSQLMEELTALGKLMDALINQKEEEVGKQRELFENLMEKYKVLLKDLLDLSKESEETREMLKGLEDLTRNQAITIEDLEIKLAAKEKKEKLETKLVKEEPVSQSAETRQDSQSSPLPIISLFGTDDEEEDDEEDDDENMKKSVEVKEEVQSSPPSSPASFSLLGPEAEEELPELVVFSPDSEVDTDSELAMGEE